MSSRTSRRNFLKRSGELIAAGLALPTIVPSRTLAANDRVGVGFIGLGSRGSQLLGGYLDKSDFPVVALSDVDETRLEAAAKRLGRPVGIYRDYRELLDSRDVDAVVIAVPDHWHAAMAIRACEAGKDVYCEKPLSLTVRQGRKMVQAARRYARVFQTGSQQRSRPEFHRACELVRNGRLGKIQRVLVNVWGTSFPCHLGAQTAPPGLDWNLWVGPAPWTPYHTDVQHHWRRYREFSGGMMTDWGAHHLDIAQWGLGMDSGGPVEILPPRADQRFVTIKYASGIPVLCGEVGIAGVQFEGSDGRITVDRGRFEAEPEAIGREPLADGTVRLTKSPGHSEDWQQSIRTRTRPVCDVEIGFRSVTVCHLANIAIWLKRSIRWDPVEEEILGDEEASRWLDRPARAPFEI